MSDPGSHKAEIELQPETEVEVAHEPARGRRRRRGSIGAESSVNMDELRELIQIINENEFTEFELEREGFRVRFRRGAEVSEASAGAFSAPRELTAAGSAPAEHVASTTSVPSHPGAKAQTEAS